VLDLIRKKLRGSSPPASTASFEQLVTVHYARLYEIAFLLRNDGDEAADLLQETLLRAFRAFHRFRPDEPIMPWLVTILRNLNRDDMRSARRRREIPAGRETEELLLEVAEEGGDAQRQLELAELAGQLAGLLRELPEYYSLPLLLVDLQEQSYEDAAAALQIPIGTLRSRLSRGRGLLRRMLFEDRELRQLLPRTTGE